MTPHQITIEGLQSFKDESLILYASSARESKQLFLTLNGSFQVHHKGEKVWEGMQPFEAVERYNNTV